MDLKLNVTVCEPYRTEDGTWSTRLREEVEEFHDLEERHCLLCTICGYPAYPECTSFCNNVDYPGEKG